MFLENFAFETPALVNFVGGGGKTSLILRLMEEYGDTSNVLYLTTTRIHPPRIADGMVILSTDQPDLLRLMIEKIGRGTTHRPYKIVATRSEVGPNLLGGVPPDFVHLSDEEMFPLILNEADGARSMSLKLPRQGEPVLMAGAQYLVPVIGMDCLSRPLGTETVFRWDSAPQRISASEGHPVTPELAAEILMHENGVCKDWKPGVKIIAYVNKADGPSQDATARDLALSILNNGNFPVERVVWGSTLQGIAGSISPGKL